MLGYYEGKTVAELEPMFKDIDMVATTLWSVAIPTGQKYMDLKNAKTRGGRGVLGLHRHRHLRGGAAVQQLSGPGAGRDDPSSSP